MVPDILGGNMIMHYSRALNPAERIDFLELRHNLRNIALTEGVEDSIAGEYTTKAAYEKIIDNMKNVNFNSLLDNKLIPPKVIFMTWASLHNSLPTRCILRRRRVQIPSTMCVLCNEEEGDLKHLFIHCKWAKPIWDFFLASLRVSWSMPEIFKALLDSWKLYKIRSWASEGSNIGSE
ncbi:uncharacterized protein LOC113359953 [Papaver somniferum]|uniref:uncharacterized protein LOC113359953 n=1 Tax=Papaver somniferum TaxID=3469 RepID=UPI000E704C4E|nr:uncharacterized protein LOC113359953 [Papaver somniferum]